MSEVAQLEQQMKNAKEIVARRDLALKLAGNREFRKLILEDFCVTEAARLVQMSSDPALSAEQRADALSMAQATGHLKRYLSMMVQMGNTAARDLISLEESLTEARAEEETTTEEVDNEDQEGTLG
jgi:hypothetical protein